MSKLIIVKSTGLLPINGGIMGPVLQPIEVADIDVMTIVSMGHDVYEVNRANPSITIKLTETNVYTQNFGSSIDPIRAAANRLKNTPASVVSKVQKASDIAVEVEKEKKNYPEKFYNKDGSYYILEENAYTHFSDTNEAIEYGITLDTLEKMCNTGDVSTKEIGTRPTPKKKTTSGKKKTTSKTTKKKTPSPQNFKKD